MFVYENGNLNSNVVGVTVGDQQSFDEEGILIDEPTQFLHSNFVNNDKYGCVCQNVVD